MHARKVFPLIAIGAVLALFLLVDQSSAADPLDPKQGKAAQDAGASGEEEPAKVKPGIVSSTGGFRGAANVDQTSTGAATGDDSSVITGSISASGKRKCTASVTNNSAKYKYSVSFKVTGHNKRGTRVLNRTFSAVIKPQATVTRTVNNCNRDLNLALKVISGRSLQQRAKSTGQ